MMLGPVFSLVSPGGPRARLSILIFHRVLPQVDPIFPGEFEAQGFDRMLGWLAQWFHVLPLDEALARLRTSSLPPRAAAISFDDGYADNYSVALPILKRHRLSATFFIATGFLDGGRMWNDTVIETIRACREDHLDLDGMRGAGGASFGVLPVSGVAEKRAAIESIIGKIKYLPVAERLDFTEELIRRAAVTPPDDLMMTSAQVVEMRRAGMQIGAHTVSHPILARLDADAARGEILASKQTLENLLDEPIGLFAYPNGKPGIDYTEETAEIVRRIGFDAAVSTTWGAAKPQSDFFQIPRFTPWDRTRLKFGLRLARNLVNSR